jgi:branched-subunit amino acid aminotransferase/4-amino-4-deoxychorismate lyase
VKGNNYLNNVLGKMEQLDAGVEAGIFLDMHGYVSECCGENLFAVSGGALRTPPVTRTLDGITRGTVIQLAREEQIPVAEVDMTKYDLYTADELFLTATMSGLGSSSKSTVGGSAPASRDRSASACTSSTRPASARRAPSCSEEASPW